MKNQKIYNRIIKINQKINKICNQMYKNTKINDIKI